MSVEQKVDIWQDHELQEERGCPLCQSVDYTLCFIRADGLPLHDCSHCGFVYLGLRPNELALTRYYGDAYFEESATYTHYFDYAEAVTDLSYCPRLARIEPYIDDWQNKKVLEIGCAAGATIELLRRRGAVVKGVELSVQAAAIAVDQYRLDVSQKPFLPVEITAGQYDVIMLFDVLEHLPSPAEVLDSLAIGLVPGGYLILSVPNFDCFDQQGEEWSGVQSYWEHLHYFRSEVLRRSLEERGFSIIDFHSFTAAGQDQVTEHRLRFLKQKMIDQIPALRYPVRLLRKAKFKLTGPPLLPRSNDFSGMDLFCLAQKRFGGVSKL